MLVGWERESMRLPGRSQTLLVLSEQAEQLQAQAPLGDYHKQNDYRFARLMWGAALAEKPMVLLR